MPTEGVSPRFADLDLWPTGDAAAAMLEGQFAAVAAVSSQIARIAAAADEAAARLRDGAGRLIYVGAGTSGRIAVQDGVELGPTYGWDSVRLEFLMAGGPGALLSSVENAEDDADAGAAAMQTLEPTTNDVAIGVAASGRTPFTLAAVEAAAQAGALTVGVACNAGTPLLGAAAHPILLDTGAEVVAGSTRMKAGTAQKVALNIFSTAVMLRLGGVHRGLMVDMRISNRKLRDRAVAMVADLADIDTVAAARALERADGNIKRAVLVGMGRSPEDAERLLRDAHNDLRAAIAAG